MNNFFFSNLYPILSLQISLFFRNKQDNRKTERGKRKERISGFVELQRSKIFVAPGFNPGKNGNRGKSSAQLVEKNVNLPSDEVATGFKQEILGENACQVKLDSKIRKTKN